MRKQIGVQLPRLHLELNKKHKPCPIVQYKYLKDLYPLVRLYRRTLRQL